MQSHLDVTTVTDERATSSRRARTAIRSLLIMLPVLLSLILLSPEHAEAWPAKESSCTACHTAVDSDANIYVAVDGTETNLVTVTAGGSFEVDFYFKNATDYTKPNGSGQQVIVPDGWTISSGTSNSPTITGGWNTAWDAAAGVGWSALYETNAQYLGTDGATINFGGSSWDTGVTSRKNKNAACDAGGSCGSDGGTDLDNTAETMGGDVTVNVPVGTSAGSYSVYVFGIGNQDVSKTYVAQIINVTVPTAYRADAMIKLSSEGDGSYLTDDTYEASASAQVKSQGVVSGSTAAYSIKFENDGSNSDNHVITGTATGSSFTVQYLDELSTDRTAAVTGAGYTISSLAAGASKVWTLNVTPDGNPSPVAGGTSYDVTVTATSSNDGAITDQVKATTSSTSANLTLVKGADKGTAIPGDEITYTVTATNGASLSNASSVVLTDDIDTNTGFKMSGATFNAGTSTLTTAITYSNDNESSWTYTPTDGGCSAPAGYDYCVTDVKWSMSGNMPTGTNFNIGLVVVVK